MSRRGSTILAALLLGSVIAAVHGPGLTSAPHWDLTQYFIERQAWPTFGEALGRLDHQVARRYWKGDEGEYRPLLFLLVAAEYALFRVDMRGWQAVNVALHALVVFLLYRLLAASHARAPALLLSLLFGVLMATTGLVGEPWVGGYLAACACLLLALHSAWDLLRRERLPEAARWRACAAWLTLAAFFCEVFAVFSVVLAGGWLLQARQRKWTVSRAHAALWLAPALAFGVLYIPHAISAPRLFFVGDLSSSYLLDPAHLAAYPLSVAEFFLRWSIWTATPTIPPFFHGYFEEYLTPHWPWKMATALNVAAVGTLAAVLWKDARRPLSVDAMWKVLSMAALLVTYAAVLRFARSATDETHLYIFALLALLILGALWEPGRFQARARAWMLGLVAVLAAINAAVSYRIASYHGADGAEFGRCLRALDAFVREHRGEPGFSFSVEPELDFLEVLVLEGYPDRPIRKEYTWLWRTFPGAVGDPMKAAYRLRWNGTELEVVRTVVPEDGIEPSRGVSPTGF